MKTFVEVSEVDILEANAVTFDRRAQAWVPCLRNRLLIRLIFRTGCRVGEVLPLGVEDVDLDLAMAKVVKEKDRLQLFCSVCGQRLARAHRFCPGCAREVSAPEKRLQEVHLGNLNKGLHLTSCYNANRGAPWMRRAALIC